jgi:predicted DNA-binding transcriptional regulator AlpA
MKTKTEINLVTSAELCKALKLTRTSIDRYRQKGMPCVKIGVNVRFDQSKVLEWIEANQTKWNKLKQKA